jgi:hypothetical protein
MFVVAHPISFAGNLAQRPGFGKLELHMTEKAGRGTGERSNPEDKQIQRNADQRNQEMTSKFQPFAM